jgi:RNA polymerase sigma factor (sigma-70 family)
MADGEQDDLELLKAWHAGSQAAGTSLYRRHEAPLRRFFASKAPPQDTDELVQQTWMAMTKNQRKAGAADGAPQIQSVRAYILGVARHVVFGYYRKNGQKTEFDPEVDNIAAIAPSVSQQLSLRRNIKRLELAMQSLPIDFQLIAEAFYIEEFTGPELAEMFNLPEGTIRSRIKRAKATIDELMRRWDIRLGKAVG